MEYDMKPIFIVLFFSLLAMSVVTYGQAPHTISYQGFLSKGGGLPVADSTYVLRFSLYAVPTSGVAIWTETDTLPVHQGTFSVPLGNVTSLSGVNLNQQLYLGVTKGTDPEFSPRSVMTSAPSSLAPWSIGGNTINYTSGNVGIGTTSPTSLFHISNGTYDTKLDGNNILFTRSDGPAYYDAMNVGGWLDFVTNGRVASDVNSNLVLYKDQNSYFNGNLGVGTSNLDNKFKVTQTNPSNFAANIATSSLANDQSYGLVVSAGTSANDVSLQSRNQAGSNLFMIRGNGNVGIGTSNPSSKLHIKGLNTTQLLIDAYYQQANSSPMIKLRDSIGLELMRIHSDNWTNSFVGYNAGSNNNPAGSGYWNTFFGSYAGTSNTTGYENTASGYAALKWNSTGRYNTAIGSDALANNVESYNTAVGYGALISTTASQYNVAVGHNAGAGYNNGYNNVFVGANTDVNAADYYNVIAIGQGTVVGGVSTARFGNSATVSYGGWASWTNVSDGRFKKNIRENVPGLEFINKLRPITYNFDATGMDAFLHRNDKQKSQMSSEANSMHQKALLEKEQMRSTGFVAQEVEAAAQTLGFDFSGVDKPQNENDYYGLRYAEFVVPLVKAVQELSAANKELQSSNDELKNRLNTLEASLKTLVSAKNGSLNHPSGDVK